MRQESEHHRYIDLRIEKTVVEPLRGRPRFADDLLPVHAPFYGSAFHYAFLSDQCPVVMQPNTAWCAPYVHDWDDLDKLELNEDNFWMRLWLDGQAYEKRRLEGICPVSIGQQGPLDTATGLCGHTKVFQALYEEPDQARRLLDFCTEALLWKLKLQIDVIGPSGGGCVVHPSGLWVPGYTGHVTIDASTMISRDSFREFEVPGLGRLFDHGGGGMLHTHSAGMHQYRALGEIENLHLVQLGQDPKTARPIDELESILEDDLRLKPLLLSITPSDLRHRIHVLRQARAVLAVKVDSEEEGRALIDLVRENSREM